MGLGGKGNKGIYFREQRSKNEGTRGKKQFGETWNIGTRGFEFGEQGYLGNKRFIWEEQGNVPRFYEEFVSCVVINLK